MTVTIQDIKLEASKVMSDVPEGGGGPSGIVLQSGKSNNIFDDITEIARAGGNLSLRQIFMALRNRSVAVGMGANIIISEPPDDPNVSVVLMATTDDFATRTQDISKLESGYVSAPTYNGYLYGNHVQGMRTLTIVQRVESAIPAVGTRLALVYREGYANESVQYVSIQSVEHSVQTFETGTVGQTYDRRVVALSLGQSLDRNYPGFDPSLSGPNETALNNNTRIRTTVWGNAAKYYGCKPLSAAATLGSYVVKVPSIYERVVPSAEAETPLVERDAAGQATTLQDASNGTIVMAVVTPFSAAQNLHLGSAVLPGSLSITVPTGAALTDSGGIVYQGSTEVGTIDYADGQINWAAGLAQINGNKTVSWKPAGAPVQVKQSIGIPVTDGNRSYNYVLTIDPLPAPGSVQVAYPVNGRWYELQDDGGGVLTAGDASIGVGTINYATGTVAVTVGALPDIGSSVIINWADRVRTINRAASAVSPVEIPLQLAHTGITPGTLEITWSDGTNTHSVGDNGAGQLTGAATGTIRYQDGSILMRPATLPAGGQQFAIEYAHGDPDQETFDNVSVGAGQQATIQLSLTDVMPGTVELSYPCWVFGETDFEQDARSRNRTVRDDGAGQLRDGAGTVCGSINYATGVVTINTDAPMLVGRRQYEWKLVVVGDYKDHRYVFTGYEYAMRPTFVRTDLAWSVSAAYRSGSSSNTADATIGIDGLSLDLTPEFAEAIVPGSINFQLGTRRYFDRSGRLYYDLDPQTGAATLAGQINYESGIVSITGWAPGTANSITTKSLLTTLDYQPLQRLTFRIPSIPLRAGSLQILVTAADGTAINVTANPQGVIDAPLCQGTANYETGIVTLDFGSWVIAAGNESEPWYDPDQVEAGKIWKPVQVLGETLRYNAVAYEYIPVDPEIVGVNPVRLPSDGRVPIFTVGDYAVVHRHVMGDAQTVVDGQDIDLGIERLSRIAILGSDDQGIAWGWARDLDAGTVKILTCHDWQQPVRIGYSIEHMALIRDAQINGQITLNRALPHDFPAGESYLSSALMLGDRYARVSALWDQENWASNAWVDYIMGNAAVATYNSTIAPIEVDNLGAITQRWVIQFQGGNTAFRVIGENVGQVATGTTSDDCSPINPATGTPYFTIRKEGWGAGWIVGNVVRMNTVGAIKGFSCIRAVQPGDYSSLDHRFSLLARVDVDRPGVGD